MVTCFLEKLSELVQNLVSTLHHRHMRDIPFICSSTNCHIFIKFDTEIKNKNPDLLNRMSEFIDEFISPNKTEWLVKALIEIIVKDAEVEPTDEFAISIIKSVTPSELQKVTKIELRPFLLSVLHYVIINRKDNERGRSTFEAWFSKSTVGSGWVLTNPIGGSITQSIKVDCIDISEETTTEEEAETIEAEVHTEDKDTSRDKTVNNNTIVNQYGENNIHINHIETFKL